MRRVLLLGCVIAAAVRADVAHIGPSGPHAVEAAEDNDGAAPLLVVLHGNNESADERAKHWREAAERRGWKLLALDCPRDLGCDRQGRWYVWNGDPSWVRDQVRALAARTRIDMSRVYLAGWSGGATYIGKKLPAWETMFAGVVIHGGGVAPSDDECPSRRLPTYFLVGDKNPTHGATRRLREYLERCDQDVRWDLVPGANHPLEDAALTPEKAAEILEWLERHRGADVLS
jgi:pimeloyl-ACP methyl ester carboxylesterase